MSTFPSFDDASGIKRASEGFFFVSLPPLADFTLSMLGILPSKKRRRRKQLACTNMEKY